MWDLRSSERTGPGKRFGNSTGQVFIEYVLPVGHRVMIYKAWPYHPGIGSGAFVRRYLLILYFLKGI